MLYTYAIVRADLEMTVGKTAAMASHACAGSLLQYLSKYPRRLTEFASGQFSGSRVIVKAKNLGMLERAIKEAEAAGLPHYLMVDEGHVSPPGFDGVTPVPAALGIGPATRDRLRPITKRFQIL